MGRVLGDAQGRERVEHLLQEQKRHTTSLLIQHQHLVAALRDALLARHELIGHEITDVLEAASNQVVDLREAVPAGARLPEVEATTP